MNVSPLALAALFVLVATPAHAEPPALSLEEAVQRLEAQNLTLAQARSRARETQGVVRQALAPLLPVAVAGGSYTRNSDEARLSIAKMLEGLPFQLPNLPEDTVMQPKEAFNGQASVRLPLFAANGYADYLAARESSRAAELSVETVRLQLRAALVQAAFWSGATEEIAAATERALGVAQEHEQSAARAVQAGTSAPLAHLQAQTEVVRRENDLARSRAERDRAWLALGVLLGRAEPVRVTLPAQPAPAAGADLESQTGEALGRRPELKAQEAAILAADWQVDSAWWRLAPQLGASFSVFASDVAFVTGEKTGWKATVDLSWTLYDGGFRYGKRAQAESQLATARTALEGQKLEIRQQVLDARRDVEVAAERLRLAERQRQLATEVAASARRSFEAGLASSLDVLDANDRLYLADVGLADARARVGMAGVALAKATGNLP